MKKLITATLATIAFSASANWGHTDNVDLMTDTDKSFIFSPAAQGDGAAVVRCDGAGSFEIMFMFDYLGDKHLPVALRFDQGEPKTYSATASTNGKARFITASARREILAKMLAGSRLVVRGTDFRGTPETFVVDLNGFSAQAKKLSCMKGVI